MRILVTGGAGFICSHLVDRLLKDGHNVQDIDCLTYAGDASLACRNNKNYTHIHKKVQDVKLRHVFEPIDTIFHLASETHVDNSISNPREFVETNVLGTFNMLQLARELKVKKFIHMSTDEVCGHLNFADPPFTVDSPICPRSPYSASKASAEHLVRAFVNTYNLPVTIVRSVNIYGPRQHVEKLIPRCITKILSGLPAPLYGTGKNVREWLFIDDAINGLVNLLKTDCTGQTVHFSSKEEKTNKEVVEKIVLTLGGKIEYVEDRKGHDLRYALAPTADFTSEVKFEDGLERTIDWYKNNEKWWQCAISRGGRW